MLRSLLSFSSPVSAPPSFVIPVFLQPGTNQVCVQDLNGLGEILRFMPFQPDAFFSLQVMPRNERREEGDQGLLAFWKSEDEVIAGTRTELRAQLADVDQSSLTPFAAVELMMLLGNSEGLRAAAHRASQLITSTAGKDTYVARVEERVRMLARLEQIDARVVPEESETIADLLTILQTPLAPTVWNKKWQAGMRRYDEDERLVSIAEWRLMDAGPPMKEFEIVSWLSSSHSNHGHEIAYKWLGRRGPSWLGYSTVWLSLARLPNEQYPGLDELGLTFLTDKSLPSSLNHTWSTIWSRLWRRSVNKEALLSIAEAAASSFSLKQDSFIEYVLMPIVDEPDHPSWAVDGIVKWLRSPRGYRVWVANYIRFGDLLEKETRVRVVGVWLRMLGNGMNLWRDLWSHTIDLRNSDEHLELAERWLMRARKDLSSWPDVFAEVMRLSNNNVSEDLIVTARDWVEFHDGRKSNHLIESVAHLDEVINKPKPKR